VLQVDDGEGNRLHAIWSRSGKHLIVTVRPRRGSQDAGQVELDADQVEQLRAFLTETLRRSN
jgi:hypothetical protein